MARQTTAAGVPTISDEILRQIFDNKTFNDIENELFNEEYKMTTKEVREPTLEQRNDILEQIELLRTSRVEIVKTRDKLEADLRKCTNLIDSLSGLLGV